MAELRRDLGLVSATALIVSGMIGVGIFLGPRVIAQSLTTPSLVLLVWILGGLFVFCGALTYAELGAMMPRSGGTYAYVQEAYGPFWAFLTGWTTFSVVKAASVSALAVAFAQFLPGLGVGLGLVPAGWTLTAIAERVVGVGLILSLTLVNVLGVRHGGRLGVVAMTLKVGALALLVLGGLAMSGRAAPGLFAQAPLPPSATALSLVSAFGVALIPVFFAFDGWVISTQVAEEVRDPGRDLPRSLILGTLFVMVVYALTNLVYLLVLGPQRLGASSFAASETASIIAGPAAGTLVIVAILVSIVGTINAVILTGPRIGYAMARDGLFFPSAANVNAFGTPGRSIALQGIIAVALVLLPPIGGKPLFETLLTYVVVDAFVFYALGASCIFVFRRTRPNAPRPYRVPLYPIVPLIFVAGTAIFLLNALLTTPRETLGGLLIAAVGVPGYLYWNAKRRPRRLRSVTYTLRSAYKKE